MFAVLRLKHNSRCAYIEMLPTLLLASSCSSGVVVVCD